MPPLPPEPESAPATDANGLANDEAIITPEDIHYYDERPSGIAAMKGHGIDLAISQKEGADYTAIVSGEVFYIDNAPKIYIRPKPYNEHVTFHNFMQKFYRMVQCEMKSEYRSAAY